jgi:hypothetical protein
MRQFLPIDKNLPATKTRVESTSRYPRQLDREFGAAILL